VPDGVRLVASVPGVHPFPGAAGARPRFTYGSPRLAECLAEPPVPPASRVEISASLTGVNSDADMGPLFYALAQGLEDARDGLADLPPGVQSFRIALGAIARHHVHVVWPTLEYALDAEERSRRFGLAEGYRAELLSGMSLSAETFERQRGLFSRFEARPHRACAGNHCKVIAGIDGGGRQCWAYIGSANLSGATWGQVRAGPARLHA
jgi:hypothetical protein